jgi:hypothetical protein
MKTKRILGASLLGLLAGLWLAATPAQACVTCENSQCKGSANGALTCDSGSLWILSWCTLSGHCDGGSKSSSPVDFGPLFSLRPPRETIHRRVSDPFGVREEIAGPLLASRPPLPRLIRS